MATKYQELVAWQLADELRRQIVAATSAGSFAQDYRLGNQVRAAANSASANIAEGFKRFHPKEFAQFLKYARASLAEINVHLDDARDRRHIDSAEHAALTKQAARTAIACARLHAYLRTAKTPTR